MSHVLLIEPDAVLGQTYQRAIRHAGHSVHTVRTAQEALDAAEERLPDIVVLELQLAAHNGVEFLHEFRSYDEWQEIPAIINTRLQPHVMVEPERALRQHLGVRAVLYKPRVSLEQLVRAINQYARAET